MNDPYALRVTFKELFNNEPLVVRSPGRINLIGEHTDYNDGFVMPAAIHKGLTFAIAHSASWQSTVHSIKHNESVSIIQNQPTLTQPGHWSNYLLGVLQQLKKRGYEARPFDCIIDSDLPPGAGLSSSAAIECGFAFSLNQLYQWDIPLNELIKLSQQAEHEWIGVKCGIMDQYANIMGKEGFAFLLDCRSLVHTYIPVQLNGGAILLCDTTVKHSLANSEYNTRRAECEQGVGLIKLSYPAVNSLRDVTSEILEACREKLPLTIYKRCAFVVAENQRVLQGADDLKNNNLEAFGRKMYDSHRGLSELYEVSCPELDFLVEEARNFSNITGARMMGGGFGGCTINIIKEEAVNTFLNQVSPRFISLFGRELKTYLVRLTDGTSLVHTNIFAHSQAQTV
jgi:galactokinase